MLYNVLFGRLSSSLRTKCCTSMITNHGMPRMAYLLYPSEYSMRNHVRGKSIKRRVRQMKSIEVCVGNIKYTLLAPGAHVAYLRCKPHPKSATVVSEAPSNIVKAVGDKTSDTIYMPDYKPLPEEQIKSTIFEEGSPIIPEITAENLESTQPQQNVTKNLKTAASAPSKLGEQPGITSAPSNLTVQQSGVEGFKPNVSGPPDLKLQHVRIKNTELNNPNAPPDLKVQNQSAGKQQQRETVAEISEVKTNSPKNLKELKGSEANLSTPLKLTGNPEIPSPQQQQPKDVTEGKHKTESAVTVNITPSSDEQNTVNSKTPANPDIRSSQGQQLQNAERAEFKTEKAAKLEITSSPEQQNTSSSKTSDNPEITSSQQQQPNNVVEAELRTSPDAKVEIMQSSEEQNKAKSIASGNPKITSSQQPQPKNVTENKSEPEPTPSSQQQNTAKSQRLGNPEITSSQQSQPKNVTEDKSETEPTPSSEQQNTPKSIVSGNPEITSSQQPQPKNVTQDKSKTEPTPSSEQQNTAKSQTLGNPEIISSQQSQPKNVTEDKSETEPTPSSEQQNTPKSIVSSNPEITSLQQSQPKNVTQGKSKTEPTPSSEQQNTVNNKTSVSSLTAAKEDRKPSTKDIKVNQKALSDNLRQAFDKYKPGFTNFESENIDIKNTKALLKTAKENFTGVQATVITNDITMNSKKGTTTDKTGEKKGTVIDANTIANTIKIPTINKEETTIEKPEKIPIKVNVADANAAANNINIPMTSKEETTVVQSGNQTGTVQTIDKKATATTTISQDKSTNDKPEQKSGTVDIIDVEEVIENDEESLEMDHTEEEQPVETTEEDNSSLRPLIHPEYPDEHSTLKPPRASMKADVSILDNSSLKYQLNANSKQEAAAADISDQTTVKSKETTKLSASESTTQVNESNTEMLVDVPAEQLKSSLEDLKNKESEITKKQELVVSVGTGSPQVDNEQQIPSVSKAFESTTSVDNAVVEEAYTTEVSSNLQTEESLEEYISVLEKEEQRELLVPENANTQATQKDPLDLEKAETTTHRHEKGLKAKVQENSEADLEESKQSELKSELKLNEQMAIKLESDHNPVIELATSKTTEEKHTEAHTQPDMDKNNKTKANSSESNTLKTTKQVEIDNQTKESTNDNQLNKSEILPATPSDQSNDSLEKKTFGAPMPDAELEPLYLRLIKSIFPRPFGNNSPKTSEDTNAEKQLSNVDQTQQNYEALNETEKFAEDVKSNEFTKTEKVVKTGEATKNDQNSKPSEPSQATKANQESKTKSNQDITNSKNSERKVKEKLIDDLLRPLEEYKINHPMQINSEDKPNPTQNPPKTKGSTNLDTVCHSDKWLSDLGYTQGDLKSFSFSPQMYAGKEFEWELKEKNTENNDDKDNKERTVLGLEAKIHMEKYNTDSKTNKHKVPDLDELDIDESDTKPSCLWVEAQDKEKNIETKMESKLQKWSTLEEESEENSEPWSPCIPRTTDGVINDAIMYPSKNAEPETETELELKNQKQNEQIAKTELNAKQQEKESVAHTPPEITLTSQIVTKLQSLKNMEPEYSIGNNFSLNVADTIAKPLEQIESTEKSNTQTESNSHQPTEMKTDNQISQISDTETEKKATESVVNNTTKETEVERNAELNHQPTEIKKDNQISKIADTETENKAIESGVKTTELETNTTFTHQPTEMKTDTKISQISGTETEKNATESVVNTTAEETEVETTTKSNLKTLTPSENSVENCNSKPEMEVVHALENDNIEKIEEIINTASKELSEFSKSKDISEVQKAYVVENTEETDVKTTDEKENTTTPMSTSDSIVGLVNAATSTAYMTTVAIKCATRDAYISGMFSENACLMPLKSKKPTRTDSTKRGLSRFDKIPSVRGTSTTREEYIRGMKVMPSNLHENTLNKNSNLKFVPNYNKGLKLKKKRNTRDMSVKSKDKTKSSDAASKFSPSKRAISTDVIQDSGQCDAALSDNVNRAKTNENDQILIYGGTKCKPTRLKGSMYTAEESVANNDSDGLIIQGGIKSAPKTLKTQAITDNDGTIDDSDEHQDTDDGGIVIKGGAISPPKLKNGKPDTSSEIKILGGTPCKDDADGNKDDDDKQSLQYFATIMKDIKKTVIGFLFAGPPKPKSKPK